ncbi:sigma-70 family RNA polymerase sigma factor [Methylotuvimicrobium buryatense]|uniref:Sigma-70 family RNA polymerase sigma factor n=1 Tax=Methylotuvimicrobium buryatense TaxID=95641 RepID=A0A4P9ULW4_METBY|nr:sigma-70 family RNA polymerase sigma factor [Methylotuvimicrobium buryatense]QCW81141.1 sigma-70 family RNA polymerase sigma factor [Methylotuvimicrobium buryatense]
MLKPSAQHIAELITEHRDELDRFIMRKLGSQDIAADILQDAFLRMTHQSGNECIENPRAFIFRIVANLVIDHKRRSVNRLPHEADEETLHAIPDNLASPEVCWESRQRLEILQQALSELPDKCRQAFYLNRVEGYTHAQIAQALNLSESMVAKHLLRAMKHCRGRVQN